MYTAGVSSDELIQRHAGTQKHSQTGPSHSLMGHLHSYYPTVSDSPPHFTLVCDAQEDPCPSWDTETDLALGWDLSSSEGAEAVQGPFQNLRWQGSGTGFHHSSTTLQASGHSLQVIPCAAALLVTLRQD